MFVHKFLAVALVFLIAGSCWLARRGAKEDEAPERETLLVVENQHSSDVTVYVMRGAARARLGTVTSMRTETFVVPRILVGSVVDLRLVADPIGGEPYVSEPVSVGPGDQIQFRLANILEQSSLSVWQ